jgi:thioredoxin reductase
VQAITYAAQMLVRIEKRAAGCLVKDDKVKCGNEPEDLQSMTYDAIVIGGSYAGLSAATMLARGRRTVLVLDAGMRRNRFAAHSYGVLAHDGRAGDEIAAIASSQLAEYPSVRQMKGSASSVEGSDGRFVVRTDNGEAFKGRKVLLATGVVDTMPEIPGLSARWGQSVFHCPYCHGYEIGRGAIGVLATSSASVAQASTLADWGNITFFSPPIADPDQLSVLRRRGVRLEARAVEALWGPENGPINVRLDDGEELIMKAIFIASKQRISPLAVNLGCALEFNAHGELISTGPDKMTSVAGVYAAGDTARLPSNVTLASADGVLAGAGIHQALIADDLKQAA